MSESHCDNHFSKVSKNIFKVLADFVFLRQCVLCGALNETLCQKCIEGLKRSGGKCLKCYRHNPFFTYCKECKNTFTPDSVIALYNYDKKLKKIVQLMKFGDVSSLCACFASQMAQALKNRIKDPVIVPIPLSVVRLRFRGYNQAHLLAKSLSEKTSWRIIEMLERKQTQFTQVEVGQREARKRNIKGVFGLKKDSDVPEEIVLIDDVITTGATIEEACRVLKRAGAKKVVVIALAMGR